MRATPGWIIAIAAIALLSAALLAQDRLKNMPGYEQYQKMARQIPAAVKTGALTARSLAQNLADNAT